MTDQAGPTEALGSEFDYDMGAVIHGEGVVTNLTYHL